MAEDQNVEGAAKFSVEVSPHSYLAFSQLKQYGEVVFWERPEFPDLPPDETDVFMHLRAHDRIDNLSVVAYADPDFLWVLAVANGTWLYPLQMQPGAKFRLLSISRTIGLVRNEG